MSLKWDYILYKEEQRYILSVECGTIGNFEVRIVLSEAQVNEYKTKDAAFLDVLAQQIRDNPHKYAASH
ncbi:MAG TPA: hypothetical protein VGB50_13690 [Flavobacterium sp.]|jgi:hypothetical protein